MKLDFSVGMGRNLRIDEVAGHARVAEDSGFKQVTFVDQQNLSRDVWAMMTIAAVSTNRILIGQGVTQPFTFHPSVIANATATVDELSGGRIFLGIGAGGNALRSMGIRPRSIEEYRDAVLFIREYMKGEEAEHNGARMHSEWVRRPVPIYMAASGPRSLRLAGEIADGAIFLGSNPEFIRWQKSYVEEGAIRAGRDPSELDYWARTCIYVAPTKEAARREVASYAASAAANRYWYLQRRTRGIQELGEIIEKAEPGLIDEFKRVRDNWNEDYHESTDAPHAQFVTQRIIDFFHIVGPPDDLCERIHQLGQIGITNISTTVFTIIDKKGMMREIASSIMPHFRN